MISCFIDAAPQPGMLWNGYDDAPTCLCGAAQPMEHALVVGDVFDHIEGTGEVEQASSRNVTRIHLHKFNVVRQALTRKGQPRRMQFGPDETLPRPRRSYRPQHCTVAAADLEKASRLRKEFVGKAYDEFVAGNEPEMLSFDLGEAREATRIHAADGVSKLRCEHGDAFALRDDMPARRATPVERPDRFIHAHRLNGLASQAPSP